MGPRLEGELFKVLKVENGYTVVVWDPEMPKAAMPGQNPCSQQPVRWWKTYIFESVRDANTFVATFLESVEG